MKLTLKRPALLLTGLLVGGKLFAQTADTMHMSRDYVQPFSGNSHYSTFSFGVNVGVLSTNTIFTSNRRLDFTTPGADLGYGAYIKDQITPTVGIRADFLGGKLTGSNSQISPVTGNSPFSSFSTKLNYSASIAAEITVGNISWKDNKSAIQPYFTVGVGGMNYTPVVTYTNGTVTDFKTGGSTSSIGEIFTPVGVGLKFDITPAINLDLGYQVNFVYSDNIDGYNFGPGNDKFSYGHIGLEFTLGSHARPQLATHNPVSSMRHEYLWENQKTRSELQVEIDADKAQIEAERARAAQLRRDLDATNAALARLTMDSDGDGVPDFFDKCPNTPKGVKVDGSGCPLPDVKPAENVRVYVTEEDRRIVNEAVRNLEFDFNKATIREHSFASLDRLAQLLMDKHFNLKLAGYTDNVGGVAFNLRLSKERAESVKNYLVGKGADASKITAEGYGKAHPIATNKTASGRQKNRRVEFTLS
jgi:OOP family OmpA-OmpF porin